MKSLGIFIATPGRKTLWRTLHSIAYQNAPIEDVLIVGDGYHQATAELVEMAAATLKLPARYVATERTRDYGHSQQNYALRHVRGDYLIYQDDDDIFLPRALTEAARLATELSVPKPIIGRVKTPYLGVIWQHPVVSKAVLDGHCLVVPNDKKKLGWFRNSYDGDQCYIHHCLSMYKHWAWADRIWTLARPEWKLWPQWSSEGGSTWCCDLHRDDGGVPAQTKCATVLLEADEDRFYATVDHDATVTVEEFQEIAEFLVYAGQSKDIWIKVPRSEGALALALRSRNFKEHRTTDDYVEYTHDWPPDFWKKPPPMPFLLSPETGQRVHDWRDPVWGRVREVVDDE